MLASSGEILSFLVEITVNIFGINEGEDYLLNKILDETEMNVGGKWTAYPAAELFMVTPTPSNSNQK